MPDSHQNTLFVILARGGSKRLPGKNLREVGGVSLLARAIHCARAAASRLDNPTRVIVSTDDQRIAEEAWAHGAKVPFTREAHLANDAATSVECLRHAVDWFGSRGESFTEVVLLQPTSPLRITRDVVEAIRNFRRHADASTVSVVKNPAGPSKHGYRLTDGVLFDDDSRDDAMVALNGAVYVCSPEWLQTHHSLCVPGKTRATVMPTARSIDIDHAEDLQRANHLHDRAVPWNSDRCFVIAEAGVNHNGRIDTAFQLIDAAAEAGADAVKFQTFTAARLATRSAPKAEYQKNRAADDESQFDMLRRLELSADQHRELIEHCHERDIRFLSSAFSQEDVDLLDALDVFAIKLGSAEITNHPLLAHAASTLRPIILSTGCSWLSEVQDAVGVLKQNGCTDLALLHCVSAYPAKHEDANLRAIATLENATQLPVGFSDHTEGFELAGPAVAMGARIIEKHFTLDRTLPGPDHQASLEPDALRRMIETIRTVESAMGSGVKRPVDAEMNTREVARRSLVAARHLPAGATIQPDDLIARRPGTAISPAQLEDVLGQLLAKPLLPDELLTWDHLTPAEAVK